MKTGLIVIVIIFSFFNLYAQSIITNRIIDFSVNNIDNIPDDDGKQIIIVDSNTNISHVGIGKKAFFFGSSVFYWPSILISDSSFNFRDTITFRDTTRLTKVCFDRKRRQVWMFNSGYFGYSYKFRKLNLRGEVLAEQTWPGSSNTLLIPDNVEKIYPDDSGGFYMLGSRPTMLSGQSVEPWMVSRFDSNGTVLWQREYIYTYAIGSPEYLEKLPNGKLFVSGYAGRQIYSLEIDPVTGNASNRKVIYNYPASNRGWSSGHAIRCANGGYFIQAFCPRSNSDRDSSLALASVDSSFRTIWQNYSRYESKNPIAIKDSTVWLMKNDSGITTSYTHYDLNGRRLHKIILFRTNNYDANQLKDVAHYSNGNAAFIGSTGVRPYTGGALYFCKISRIGAPYNPTYPAWPPMPTSDTTTTTIANLSKEPALQLYPNPGHATMHVSHTGELYLYNLQGQLVMQRSTQAGDVISTSRLPSGAYLACFQTKTCWHTSRWVKD